MTNFAPVVGVKEYIWPIYYVIICINSGSKGGTGKTTFAEVLSYTWRVLEISTTLAKPPVGTTRRGDVFVVDFPAFSLTDEVYTKALRQCRFYVYVVDEDLETLRAVETIHVLYRREVLGVVLNKVVKTPGKFFVSQYQRLGKVYVVPFDEKLAVHRTIGTPPYKIRSVAVAEMAKSAVHILKKINSYLIT